MAEEKVNLAKEAFNKAKYIKTIDTSFRELGITTVAQDIEEEVTVEEFFQQYNELFYDIPALGDTNSHEYLVKQSGDYINFERDLEEIQALRQEIAELREELLAQQLENLELAAGQTPSDNRRPRPGETKKEFIVRINKEATERANNTGQ